MFGNRLGWGLAGAMVGAIALALYYLHTLTQPSPPTAVGQAAASFKLTLSMDPRTVATYMSEERDATEQYRSALAHYQSNGGKYEAFMKDLGKYIKSDSNASPQAPPKLEGVELLVKARTARTANIFSVRPADVIRYNYYDGDPMRDLEDGLGKATYFIGNAYASRGDNATAKPYYQALFAMAVHLYEERLVFDEMRVALAYLSYGEAVAKVESDPSRAKMWHDFEAARAQLGRTTLPDSAYIHLRQPPMDNRMAHRSVMNLNNAHTGDMIAFAKNGGDRMWRIEAILALGRCRFTGSTWGDQRGAQRYVTALADDPKADPMERFAARKARDLAGVGEVAPK